MRNSISLTLMVASMTALAGLAKAQSSANPQSTNARPPHANRNARGSRAIDQNVEDTDPLSTSLRRVDRGNSRFPTRSMIARNPYAASWQQADRSSRLRQGGVARRRYTFRGPGIKALIDRAEYVTVDQSGEINLNASAKIDGAFKGVVPPNAVYSLLPDYVKPTHASRSTNPKSHRPANAFQAARVTGPNTGQIPGRVDRRLHLRVNSSVTDRKPNPGRASFAEIVRRQIRHSNPQATAPSRDAQ